MIRWLLRRRIEAFEKAYAYDLSYVREILEVSPRAALRLGRVAEFGKYCEGVPRDAIFAARLAGTMAEDCGPCTQLIATMAEREGVASSTIKAILAGNTGYARMYSTNCALCNCERFKKDKPGPFNSDLSLRPTRPYKL